MVTLLIDSHGHTSWLIIILKADGHNLQLLSLIVTSMNFYNNCHGHTSPFGVSIAKKLKKIYLADNQFNKDWSNVGKGRIRIDHPI